MNLPSFSQRDTKWANIGINKTSSTIGKYGCTITCIGDMYDKNPQDMNDQIMAWKAYSGDLVLWSKIPTYQSQFWCQNTPAPINDIKNKINSGYPVLLCVSFEKNGNPNHWVLGVEVQGDNIIINDPWYGDRATIAPRYGKDASTAILGGSYFNLKPNIGGSMAQNQWVKYVNHNNTGAILLEVNNGNEIVNVPIKNPNFVPWSGASIPAVEVRPVQGVTMIKPNECPPCPPCPPANDCGAIQEVLDICTNKRKEDATTITALKDENKTLTDTLTTTKEEYEAQIKNLEIQLATASNKTLDQYSVPDRIKSLLRTLFSWSGKE